MLDLYSGYNIPIYGITVSAISFLVILFATPKIISSLIAKGEVVEDYHKPDKPPVPRPAGPVLLIGIAVAEIVIYLLTFNIKVIAIFFTSLFLFHLYFV